MDNKLNADGSTVCLSQVLNSNNMKVGNLVLLFLLLGFATCQPTSFNLEPLKTWMIGEPIVSYWAGPGFPNAAPLTNVAANLLAEGGWNLVWCHEDELDVAERYGLRCQMTHPYFSAVGVEQYREEVGEVITRVKNHPALYSYFISDEPSTADFPDLIKVATFLLERDPEHLIYINLHPIYAPPGRLGTEQSGAEGNSVTAYKQYLKTYIEMLNPLLLSYDNYPLYVGSDREDYFLNLALMRDAALGAGLPFMNIVQGSSWSPTVREPTEGELRFFVYTSLAYGAQGISYYGYSFPDHVPGITTLDRQPTKVYDWLTPLNLEFVAIAKQVKDLTSLGAYHAGMNPPGGTPLTNIVSFQLTPPLETIEFVPGRRVGGVLIGTFSMGDLASHAVVVNLDYTGDKTLAVTASGGLELFDPATETWLDAGGSSVTLNLLAGGGSLLRLK